MPFKQPGALESFREKMESLAEWRTNVLCDLVWDVAPVSQPVTWSDLAEKAASHYETVGADGDPMFERYSDSFITPESIYRRRSDIRERLAEEDKFLIVLHGIGVRKAQTTDEIVSTMTQEARVVQSRLDRYNYRAELAHAHRQAMVPAIRLLLELPGGNTDD